MSEESVSEPVPATPNRLAQCKYYGRIFVAHLFSHVGLCGLVIGYSLVGALTFEALESKHEVVQRNHIREYRDSCLRDMWDITLRFNVLYEKNWTDKVEVRLREFELKVVEAVKNEGYDGKESADLDLQWSFSGALLYCITVITTIGYGNIAPKTDIGKVVTIFYALLGIPLMLLCLSNIGNLLAHSFKFTYSRICCAVFRKHPQTTIKPRKTIYRQSAKENSVPNFGKKEDSKIHIENSFEEKEKPPEKVPLNQADIVLDTKHLDDLEIIEESTKTEKTGEITPDKPSTPTEKKNNHTLNLKTSNNKFSLSPSKDTNSIVILTSGNKSYPPSPTHDDVITVETTYHEETSIADERVPIYMVLLLVTAYICGGATLFSLWEDWSFLDGAYFCFITLSTIGFGDLVPGGSIFGADAESGQAKLIICCFYLILGLAVIAMSFNLVQEEVVHKCKTVARNLGILTSEDRAD